MQKDLSDGRRIGDEGDEANVTPAGRAHHRKLLGNPREELCPGDARGVNDRFKEELAALEAFEKRKDFYGLHTAFLACKKTYSVLDDFKEKTQRYDDALKQPDLKAEIKLGGRYAQMMTTLKKSQSKTALANLERFAAENPESLYGKWAATVVQKYQAENIVVDPSTEEPPPGEEKSLPTWGAPAEL